MPVPTLDHVQIAAPPDCEPAARHFFGDLLGLRELPKPAPLRARGGCWFALGDRQLHIGVDFPITWDTALPTERRFYSADPWGNRIELLAAA
jgi:catechol 2,3-dioxygenase-like lactoylglutathione lyase family enzyme